MATIIESLNYINIVNIVNFEGNNYYVLNSDVYAQDKIYTIGKGTYIFKNIPQEHPMAILNKDVVDIVTYTGDQSKKSIKIIDAYGYDFYHGDITVTVTGDFVELSIYCYNHGYMGGEGILVYNEDASSYEDVDLCTLIFHLPSRYIVNDNWKMPTESPPIGNGSWNHRTDYWNDTLYPLWGKGLVSNN